MGQAYLNKEDSLTALETLVEGARKYSADIGLMNQLIQLLVDLDRRDEAIKYIDKAIETNDNVNYYLVKGDLYNKDGNEENAIRLYEQAIQQEPENVMALYNLGVVYYNRGVKQVELANQVPINDQAAYKEGIRKSLVWWK
jgi:tetratricopeptide (TPR) repeat protein